MDFVPFQFTPFVPSAQPWEAESPAERPKKTQTLGLQMVRLLTEQLGGSIEINGGASPSVRSAGPVFRITFAQDRQRIVSGADGSEMNRSSMP